MMLSSSPEYAMYDTLTLCKAVGSLLTNCRTKPPGMAHHLSRKRDKPLRTYGKRSTATPEPRGEPPAKKVRTEEKDAELDAPSSTSPFVAATERAPSDTSEPPRVPDEERPKQDRRKSASILNYFKPVLQAQRAVPSSEEDPHASAEPPSVQTRLRRRTRLLRIRATSSPLSDALEGNAETRNQATNDKKRQDGNEEEGSANDDDPRRGKPLHESGENLLNQIRSGDEDPAAKLGGATKAKTPSVQTTLNISAQAAFAECKVCDTVWNPLYPDDVKYHAKRHAAVAKAKRKRDDEL
ncbi:Cwh43p [Purpureocillium lavendulum]|uniref:Cwh43p n=1 Tax=Purpureocillium lavendulum TaxID=1247861 RepID=A0AB34FQY7_9HYPO|nr:Cwh43p [Purpureocillium lavendulum]